MKVLAHFESGLILNVLKESCDLFKGGTDRLIKLYTQHIWIRF